MFHAILITHGLKSDRFKKAEELTQTKLKPNPDILILEPDPSITIKQVRNIEIFLSKKAYQLKTKIVLIHKAYLITLPAQHALLKTLEEPPANSQIILLAPNQNYLLDTIISRCHLIQLKPITKLNKQSLQTQQDFFESIEKSRLSQRITIAAQHAKNKQTALDFCMSQLVFLKSSISMHSSTIKKLNTSISQLNANLNPKLVLESLLFAYPKN